MKQGGCVDTASDSERLAILLAMRLVRSPEDVPIDKHVTYQV